MQIQYVCDTLFFLNLQKGKYPVKKRYFTLVELLVVVGIVVILAGLVLPAVIGGAQQGRITQAKADMKSIQMALAQMDQTYGRILKTTGSGSSLQVPIATGKSSSSNLSPDPKSKSSDSNITSGSNSTYFVRIGAGNPDDYNSLIAELTGTGKCGNSTGDFLGYQHNSRKIKFLDPHSNFDPTINYNAAPNIPYLWRDPWGNPYNILINIDGNERIVRPDNNSKYIMEKTAIYSYGPNGENNNGKNAAEGGDKLDDDIATWHK